ncbi:MAG: hypothetical protein H7X95_14215, partial [Deltaproteobacteria bacterium]|nr:hypothetical protein [Deltaproteobacteria bacterium]
MAGETLLVVDDSPTILKVVESALTRAGYQVDTALDVPSGMALARSRRPAAILIDSLIPGQLANQGSDQDGNVNPAKRSKASGRGKGSNEAPAGATGSSPDDSSGKEATGGLHLCAALAADSALSHTPIVLMTAKGEDLETRYAQAPNVVDYITKPFSPDAIVAVVTHVIEKTAASAKAKGTEKGAHPAPVENQVPVPAAGVASAVAQALSQSVGPTRPDTLGPFKDALADRLERF